MINKSIITMINTLIQSIISLAQIMLMNMLVGVLITSIMPNTMTIFN